MGKALIGLLNPTGAVKKYTPCYLYYLLAAKDNKDPWETIEAIYLFLYLFTGDLQLRASDLMDNLYLRIAAYF